MASNAMDFEDGDPTMSTSESDHDYEPASATEDESEDLNNETEELIQRLMPGAWAEDAEDDGMQCFYLPILTTICKTLTKLPLLQMVQRNMARSRSKSKKLPQQQMKKNQHRNTVSFKSMYTFY